MTTYIFRWGRKAVAGKVDPMHTISNLDADAYLDYWISSLRPGTPWQFVSSDGHVMQEGVR